MEEVRVPRREACRITRAYLFSHFDSRGGSTLVVGTRLSRALDEYAATFGFGDDDQLASDLAEDDYVARYTVVVCDRPVSSADDGEELLADYRDDGRGYRFGVVQTRWHDPGRRRWSRWEDTSFAVLWVDDAPAVAAAPGPFRREFRLQSRDVGEDAWGLGLIWSHREHETPARLLGSRSGATR